MLQRAASNAYSWWWASHIRTKQSKWLEQSLLDMEEKVASTLKIIDHDGDSFAKRAEMYYRKRPELIEFVEESYKAYRALAERYDHLSRELQSANRKIATAFPEEVPFEVDDEDFDEQLLTGTKPENRQQKELPDGSKARIPKVPAGPGKEFRSTSRLMSRKGTLRKTPSYAKPVATAAIPTSGLTKEEATAEIDKLQKDILSFQTEKEFVKSSYERGRERYWEIENHIMDMQKKVCDLQDEFEIGIVIEDNEARKLMAMTALKSCQTSLAKLQERHERSEVEVKIEEEKIDQAIEKFEEIRGVSVPRQREDEDEEKEDEKEKETSMKMEAEPEVETEKVAQKEDAIDNLESAWEKMKEEIDAKLSVPELAEKIDNLVDKVVNLEIEVSRQAAQVRRLRSETAALQALILNLEKEHKTVVSSKIEVGSPEDSKMNNKLKEFEEDLIRVKNLKQQVLEQCRGLLSQFNEASSNLNQLSEKLETVKLDDDVEMTGLFREAKAVPPKIDGKQEAEIIEDREKDDSVTSELKSADAKDDDDDNPSHRGPARSTADEESLMQSGPSSDFDASSEKPHEHTLHHDKDESLEELAESTADTDAHDLLDDQPNWRQLFLNGLEDREKVLLEEYTSILRSYKDVKSKLSEAEKKNRDGLFEMAMQIRELRNENSQREEEIKSLRQKLGISGDNGYQENHKEPRSRDSNLPSSASKPSTTTTSSGKQPLYKLLLLQNDILSRNQRSHSATDGEIQVHHIAGAPDVLSMEEKFRSEIDDLLEENMEFWLRFSTSIHQIQKFQTTFHDLQAELSRLKINKKQQEGTASSVASEARPIYKHLREIQTEIKFWLEHHTLLNEELQNRHSVLGNIQDGISRVLEGGSRQGEAGLTEYQAAKLQGEVLNMRQESKKVSEELRAGQERVRKLQAEIERTLSRLDEVLGISTSKSHSSRSRSSSKSRIPLRSFLFGVKLKKQKPSIFSCMSPALQKQGSELGTRYVNLD